MPSRLARYCPHGRRSLGCPSEPPWGSSILSSIAGGSGRPIRVNARWARQRDVDVHRRPRARTSLRSSRATYCQGLSFSYSRFAGESSIPKQGLRVQTADAMVINWKLPVQTLRATQAWSDRLSEAPYFNTSGGDEQALRCRSVSQARIVGHKRGRFGVERRRHVQSV